MKRLLAILTLLVATLSLAPAHAVKPEKPAKGGGRYQRGEHGPGTDAGRRGGTWQKHTDPRSGRDTTKNRSKPGWQDRSGKRKP